MSWRDAIALAVTSVRRRIGRAVLTVAAVALAAALMTALLTIAGTARTRVLNEVAEGGPLSGIRVAAAEVNPAEIDQDDPDPGDPRVLDDSARRRIADLPGVRTILPVRAARLFVISPTEIAGGDAVGPYAADAVGLDLSAPNRLPVTVLQGRLPDPGTTTEVAVTETWLKRYGLDRTDAARMIGTEIEAGAARLRTKGTPGLRPIIQGRWSRMEITGVVAQDAASGELILPLDQITIARAWTASSVDRGVQLELPRSPYAGLLVVAQDLDAVGGVRDRINDIGYSNSAPENLVTSVQRYLGVVEIVLTAIGVIALLVAGLGIANALLAAIRERRSEIGVLKAIGARDRDVRRIFLVEAAALGLLGGVIGTAIGYGGARLVATLVNRYLSEQGLTGIEAAVPVTTMTLVVAGSALLAVIAGTVPAMRAARLPAREAMGAGG